MKTVLFTLACTFFGMSLCLAQRVLPEKNGAPVLAISSMSAIEFSPQSAFLSMEIARIHKEGKKVSADDTDLISKYSLFVRNNEVFVNTFLIISEDFDESVFNSHGFTVNSKGSKVITTSIPVERLTEVSAIEGVEYVQIAEKAVSAMDNARAATWVDWVHQGAQLPQPYFGTDVVVGIIDSGFDYTHPNFYDGTGSSNYRLKKVWEQSATTGTPPSGFSYGRELANQNAILNAQRDMTNESHGTHVAGIAAGAGGGVNTNYMGVAPQSDLVFVSTPMTTVSIADAIAYIFNYANSVSKPCVINMSIGGHVGPHDGFSAFDQYCDDVVGNGRLLVGAASNDGSNALYLEKTYNASNNIMYTFLYFPNSPISSNGQALVDIWGNPNQNYQVGVNIYDVYYDQFISWTPYIQANSNNTSNYTLYDSDFVAPDPCYITIAASHYPLNNKYNVQISIDNALQDDMFNWVIIEITANTGTTKMWAAGGGAHFSDGGMPQPCQSGSTNSTMGEIGGTGNSIISVGAYTTKNSWTALNGSSQTADFNAPIGAIAPFSSKGPTADGRTKPDITAPGNVISASVSSFDSNYQPSSNYVVSSITNGPNSWRFAQMQGTSMASPLVTGILALWLQAFPNMNHTQALTLLKNTAWTDSHTGTIPASGNNTWGWGKVDAHEGLLSILAMMPSQPNISVNGNLSFCEGQSVQLSAPAGFSAYQWSNNATTQTITVSAQGSYSVRVMDSQGFISPWSEPAQVTVSPAPPVPTISVSGNVLSSSAPSGNQWYLNNNMIAGATQQNHTAQQTGSYHVTVTNGSNCSSQSNPITINTISIDELESAGITSLFPNPVIGQLHIEFSKVLSNVDLSIYDINGRLVKQQQIASTAPGNIETLNLEELSNGIYNLSVQSTEQRAVMRIVVSK